MENMIEIGGYNVANNGKGEIVAQHAIIALECKCGPEVAIGDTLLTPEGAYGIRLRQGNGGGVIWPSGKLSQIDKRR